MVHIIYNFLKYICIHIYFKKYINNHPKIYHFLCYNELHYFKTTS